MAQDRESSPAESSVLNTMLRRQLQPRMRPFLGHIFPEDMGVDHGPDWGQVLPKIGVDWSLLTKADVSTCYVHLRILYCDVML